MDLRRSTHTPSIHIFFFFDENQFTNMIFPHSQIIYFGGEGKPCYMNGFFFFLYNFF